MVVPTGRSDDQPTADGAPPESSFLRRRGARRDRADHRHPHLDQRRFRRRRRGAEVQRVGCGHAERRFVAGEVRHHAGVGEGVQRPDRRRALRGRRGEEQVVRRGQGRAGQRLERGGRRPAPGCLVAGRVRLGQPAAGERQGRQRVDRAGRRPAADRERPAGRRDAEADGRGTRLAGQGHRLEGPRRARHRPGGLGEIRPPRVGQVPAGQDEPEYLDVRPERHHRCLLRGHRHLVRPHRRRTRKAAGEAVRHGHRAGDRALRRQHADLPDQPAEGRRPLGRAVLHLGGDRRGELPHRLQPRQPHERSHQGRPARAAEGATGRDLPERRHAQFGPPVRHAELDRSDAQADRRGLPGLPALTGVAAALHEPGLPHLRRQARATGDRGQRRPAGREDQLAEPAVAAGARQAAQRLGRAAQEGERPAGRGRLGLDGRRGQGHRQEQDRRGQAGRDRLAEPVPAARPGRAVDVRHPARRRQGLPGAAAGEPARAERCERADATARPGSPRTST